MIFIESLIGIVNRANNGELVVAVNVTTIGMKVV